MKQTRLHVVALLCPSHSVAKDEGSSSGKHAVSSILITHVAPLQPGKLPYNGTGLCSLSGSLELHEGASHTKMRLSRELLMGPPSPPKVYLFSTRGTNLRNEAVLPSYSLGRSCKMVPTYSKSFYKRLQHGVKLHHCTPPAPRLMQHATTKIT